MTGYLKKVGLIFWKDWQEEFREWNNLLSTVIFALVLACIFGFSLNLSEQPEEPLFPALIWVIILFASTLGMLRAFAREKENDVLDAVILATGERSAIFFGKFLGNLTLLLLVEMLVVPIVLLLLDFQGTLLPGLFLGTLLLGSWGLSLLGTFLHSITVQIQEAQLLLPILLFPLAIPLLIGVVECTRAALGWGTGNVQIWIYFLVMYDLVFMLVPLLLFDYVLEG